MLHIITLQRTTAKNLELTFTRRKGLTSNNTLAQDQHTPQPNHRQVRPSVIPLQHSDAKHATTGPPVQVQERLCTYVERYPGRPQDTGLVSPSSPVVYVPPFPYVPLTCARRFTER